MKHKIACAATGLALVLSSCTPTPNPSPTTTTTAPPVPNSYVAMGDSYSSGWGAGNYDNSNCGRSNHAYPIGIQSDSELPLKFVACGGADTRHILNTSLGGEPPQVNNVTSDTQLVTLTIGGNDAALIWMLDQCVKAGNCIPQDWFGNNFIGQMNTKINALQGKIVNVLNAIIAKNPNTKIIIAGYPYILPAVGQPKGNCAKWLRDDEQAMFADATIRVNGKIRDAVLQVGNPNVTYVDPMTTFPLGKDGCSTDPDKYMIGYEIPLAKGGWHPNSIGQQLYRDLFAGAL